MAKDKWLDHKANWNTPSDWSLGLPDASSNVLIGHGNPEVTESFGTVNSIAIEYPTAILTFIDAGASSVARGVTNSGSLYLDPYSGDGGSSLTIGGKLTNSGTLQIGPTNGTLSAASTVEASHLANITGTAYGTIDLFGSATAEATLDVGSTAGFGAAGVLYGNVDLSGDALAEFKGGQITTIAANSALYLFGSNAFVADASDTSSNSALKGLQTVAGYLDLENGATVTTSGGLTNSGTIQLYGLSGSLLHINGALTNSGTGYLFLENGATVTTSGGLTNSGEIRLYGLSGSLLHINGALTNSRTIEIGPESMVEAASVVNDGAIVLFGDKAIHASLHSAGPFTNDGKVVLNHDTDTIAGAVSGTGDFNLLNYSTLEFGSSVSSGETVTFKSFVDHLYLDSPSSFNGTIDDFFTPGDSVIAKGFAEAQTMLTYTQTGADSCSWTLTDGAHTAVLNLAGEPYAKSDFSISASANGNSLIKFV